MKPAEGGHSALGPELGHLHQVLSGDLGGQPQDGGVSVTH